MKTFIYLVSFFFVFVTSTVAQNSTFETFKKAQQAEFDSFKNQKNSDFEAFKKAQEKEFNDFVIASKDSSAKSKNQQDYVPEQGNIVLEEISTKDIKNILKEYHQEIGDYPINLFLKENRDSYSFKITKPIPGQTNIAAELTLSEILRLNSVNTFENRVFTFEKDGPNKGVILIKMIAFKK